MPSPVSTVADMLSHLLDRDFIRVAGPVLQAIATDPRVASALSSLQREAERLSNSKEPLARRNAALTGVRSALELSISAQTPHLNTAGAALEAGAIATGATIAHQMALTGGLQQLPGYTWQIVREVKRYTTSRAWNSQLNQFGAYAGKRVGDIALSGIVDGQNPVEIARTVQTAVTAIPRANAEALLRTVQLSAYRRANADNYAANSDILEPMGIRIAALDDRTCPVCVELHGTEVPIDEDIESHYNCRCTVVPVIVGFPRDIQTGEDWFDAQDEARQQRILGKAGYNAWNDGAVSLSDFVGHTNDPIFGQMLATNSLKGILGAKEAKQFYSYNRN